MGSSRVGGLGDKLGCLWDTQLEIEIGVSRAMLDLEPLGVSEQTQGECVAGHGEEGRVSPGALRPHKAGG